MNDSFKPISLDDMKRYKELHAASGTRASDYSFINLWGWAQEHGLVWRFSKNLCWIKQTIPATQYWAPIGKWSDIDWSSEKEIISGNEFIRMPAELCRIWKEQISGQIKCEDSRGQWDYLYRSKDLAALSGSKLNKKKNLLNQFSKKYPEYEYLPLTSKHIDKVLLMQKKWYAENGSESKSLTAENSVIRRVLNKWDLLPGLTGSFITVKNEVIAYTVGEQLTKDTLVIHFEKGDTGYKGVYQAVNNFFARDNASKFAFINREQDMNNKGLRKAKESYDPADYVKKYTVRIL